MKYTVLYPPFSGNPPAEEFGTFDEVLAYIAQHPPWTQFGQPLLVGSYWDDTTDGLEPEERERFNAACREKLLPQFQQT